MKGVLVIKSLACWVMDLDLIVNLYTFNKNHFCKSVEIEVQKDQIFNNIFKNTPQAQTKERMFISIMFEVRRRTSTNTLIINIRGMFSVQIVISWSIFGNFFPAYIHL